MQKRNEKVNSLQFQIHQSALFPLKLPFKLAHRKMWKSHVLDDPHAFIRIENEMNVHFLHE